jgi:hypothetical protein
MTMGILGSSNLGRELSLIVHQWPDQRLFFIVSSTEDDWLAILNLGCMGHTLSVHYGPVMPVWILIGGPRLSWSCASRKDSTWCMARPGLYGAAWSGLLYTRCCHLLAPGMICVEVWCGPFVCSRACHAWLPASNLLQWQQNLSLNQNLFQDKRTDHFTCIFL